MMIKPVGQEIIYFAGKKGMALSKEEQMLATGNISRLFIKFGIP